MGNLLDRMEPLLAAMPAVRSSEGHVHFKNKLIWTLGILILYFAPVSYTHLTLPTN